MSKKTGKKSKKSASSTASLQNVSLRIYKGFAEIEGAYPVTLVKGKNTFQIAGLPVTYQERSLQFDHFDGPAAVTLGPRRFRAANLTTDTLRELFLNKKVTVRYQGTKGECTLKGTYLGMDGNTVLLRVKGGAIREVPNFVAFEYDQLPEGVSNTPALQVTVEADEKGEYVAFIALKASGFNWDADYTILYNEKTGLSDWTAEIHVTNESGADFSGADISVIAGDVNVQQRKARPHGAPQVRAAAGLEASADFSGGAENVRSKNVRVATAESIGQVKEYPVPEKNDLQQGEDQTLDFFAATGVPTIRELRVRSQSRWHASANKLESPVRTHLHFQSGENTPLNIPLPGGTVTVRQKNKKGKKVECGGDTKKDNALGDLIKMEIGTDFDVKAVRFVKDSQTKESYVSLPEVEDEEGSNEVIQMPEGPQFGAQTAVKKVKKVRSYEKTTVVTKQCVFELFNGKDEGVEVIFEEVTDANLQLLGDHGFTQVVSNKFEQKVFVAAGKRKEVPYTLVLTSKETVQLTDAQFRALQPQE